MPLFYFKVKFTKNDMRKLCKMPENTGGNWLMNSL